MSAITKNAPFMVDVNPPDSLDQAGVQKQGSRTIYWKTGHSYMNTNELGTLAGVREPATSFDGPLGRGYDDGPISAIATWDMFNRAPVNTSRQSCEDRFATLSGFARGSIRPPMRTRWPGPRHGSGTRRAQKGFAFPG
jgi:hypothetical protein